MLVAGVGRGRLAVIGDGNGDRHRDGWDRHTRGLHLPSVDVAEEPPLSPPEAVVGEFPPVWHDLPETLQHREEPIGQKNRGGGDAPIPDLRRSPEEATKKRDARRC